MDRRASLAMTKEGFAIKSTASLRGALATWQSNLDRRASLAMTNELKRGGRQFGRRLLTTRNDSRPTVVGIPISIKIMNIFMEINRHQSILGSRRNQTAVAMLDI